MKILAFSDLHLDLAAAKKLVELASEADIVVGAGDFATRQRGIARIIGALKAIKTPTVLVPGNHDDLDELTGACSDWNAATILHGDGAIVAGISFFGLGYEAPRSSAESWNRFLTEEDTANMLAPCPKGAILMTHAPPYGVADVQANGNHGGSTAIRATIEERVPKLHLCGHIHHSWGQSGAVGPCRTHNLGPNANWFTLCD